MRMILLVLLSLHNLDKAKGAGYDVSSRVYICVFGLVV